MLAAKSGHEQAHGMEEPALAAWHVIPVTTFSLLIHVIIISSILSTTDIAFWGLWDTRSYLWGVKRYLLIATRSVTLRKQLREWCFCWRTGGTNASGGWGEYRSTGPWFRWLHLRQRKSTICQRFDAALVQNSARISMVIRPWCTRKP